MCCTENTDPLQLSAALLDKQSIKEQVKQLQHQFRHLGYCTYKELVDEGINVDDVHAWLTSLDVFQQQEHQDFIKDHLTNIEKLTSLNNLWARLGIYWNFLNFDLLEHLVNGFGSKDLKQKMGSYNRNLQSFRKATRVCDFIDCWPSRVEPPPGKELKEFVTKVGYNWEDCTLEDLDMLQGVITRKFFLPQFALRLKEIKPGSIVITWLIPVPFEKAVLETIQSTSSEFFVEQKLESITIDGQDCYPTWKLDYPKEQHMLEPEQTEKPSAGILPEKLHSFEPATSEEQPLPKRMRLAEEILSGESTSIVPSEKVQFDTYPGDIQGEKSTPSFLSKLKQMFRIPEGWFETSTPPEKDVRKGGWVNPPTPAEKYVREKCVDKISHVKLLASVEEYLSKAEVEADPSLPTKYKDYLSSTPAIRAALYTTFNAKMAAEVFTWSQHTESPPPTTMTELFTAFTLKTLVDHFSTHPVYHKQQLKVTTFSDLPTDVYKQFLGLCRMAYEGILNRQQLVFSAAHLPTGFAPLGLMQEVPQLYTEGGASSYHFIHLTVQEYLAAVHISQLPAHEQTRLFQEHVNSGHFKMTMRFLAGLTKLANIPHRIRMVGDTELNYFHLLFEAKDISMTTRTLGSREMFVSSHYSWTPLDYYVTGHAISHSNCPWSLNFEYYSIDGEKFELFCQGCAAPGGAGCSGHISHANFSSSDLTSKSIQSFVNIPPHILQDMRKLDLSHNKLDESACDLLAKVVPSMTRLEKLELGYNQIESGGAVEMIKALCDSGVKQLNMQDNPIGVEGASSMSDMLQHNTSLEELTLCDDSIGEEGVHQLINSLKHNQTLRRLWLPVKYKTKTSDHRVAWQW